MAEAAIQYLQDREAIRSLLERYYKAVDSSDLDLMKTVFLPDGTWNFNKGSLLCNGMDEIWAIIGPVGNNPAMHFMGNHFVQISGDAAKSDTYGIAHVVRKATPTSPERDGLQGLRYQDFLVRTKDGWRVKARTQLVEWQRGDLLLEPTNAKNRELGKAFKTPEHWRQAPQPIGPNVSSKDPLIQDLIDRQALRDLMTRYYYCVDRYDFEGVKSIFTPDAFLDFNAGTWRDSGVDKISKMISGIYSNRLTFHFMGTQRIDVQGDTANMDTYAMAHHLKPAGDHELDTVWGLRYVDQAVRTKDGWRVKHRTMIADWKRESPSDRLVHAPMRWTFK